jgi:transketolase
MIIAKTLKGKGVSFIEDKNGWHGKPLKKDELARALQELGTVDKTTVGKIEKPEERKPAELKIGNAKPVSYAPDKPVATRRAYGTALERICPAFPDMVVLDAEVSNSTFSEIFKASYPERFFEMYIAEQNMVGNALGLSIRGKIPFVSTFAAFLTRAFDQIRMSQYSLANIKFCGSHAGVSIGEDGSSQMGLEDIAMFRTLLNSVVLYPADAVSTEKLVEEMAKQQGIAYIRTTRKDTPIIYRNDEAFRIGGSKVLKSNKSDVASVVAAGITLHETLKAYEELKQEGISVRVIDLYSIKPIDAETLVHAAKQTGIIVTVEDHFAEGGLGEAVQSALAGAGVPVYSLAVRNMPRSGKPDELLGYEEISHTSIAGAVKDAIRKKPRSRRSK